LKTVETPLLAGRDFDEHDLPTGPNFAIVNQKFAQEMLHTSNPIGMMFSTESYTDKGVDYQIVGMAKDTKYSDMRDDFEPLVYVPASQDKEPDPYPSYLIRSDLALDALTAEVKEATNRMNPAISLDFRVFNTQIAESLARERMMAMLSGFFGILAGVLAVVGIYGVISYMVVRRTNEIGVRLALGANRTDILGLIMREAGVLLGLGLLIGTALAYGAARWSSSLLYGLKPTDLATYAGSIVLLSGITIAASFLPAQRASRLDPMAALRDE
jgi:ABC-type antimicrobial peptide transport system permease subunit